MNNDQTWPADNQPSSRWPVYTRGNIGEVYPDVVLPLEWDLAGAPSELGWREGAQQIGFVVESDFDPDEDMTFIGVFGGYAYFNASIMRLLGVRTPGVAVDLIDQQFLGECDVPPYVPRPGDRNLVATSRLVRSALSTMLAKDVPLLVEMKQRADTQIAAAPGLDAPTDQLWSYVKQAMVDNWAYFIRSHVTISTKAMIASGQLTDLCDAQFGDPNLALVLTTGIGEVRSAGPAEEMWRLANETSEADFDTEFAEFLTEYGHRGPNEFSVAGKDWAAYPEIALAAIDLLRGVDGVRSPQAQQQQARLKREAALLEARARMGWQKKRLDSAIANTALWSRAREASKDEVIRAVQAARHAVLELFRRAAKNGGVQDTVGPMLLTRVEFEEYLANPASIVAQIEARREQYQTLCDHEPPFAFSGVQPPVEEWVSRSADRGTVEAGQVLVGAAGSPGLARGWARVLTDPSDPSAMEPGDILVAPLTDPSWTPLFLSAEAVVVEVGAALSHSMIVSRELGIPCVVGIALAASIIPDGALIEVDGQAGTVRILELPEQ